MYGTTADVGIGFDTVIVGLEHFEIVVNWFYKFVLPSAAHIGKKFQVLFN